MTAPPPMPNVPARMPVTTPPMTTASASQAISLNGTPKSIFASVLSDWKSGGDVRQSAGTVQRLIGDQRERRCEVFGPCMRHGGGAGKMPAECARAGDGAEQTVQMPCDAVQPRAPRQFAVDIRHQRRRGRLRRGETGGFAEDQWIDGNEPPRLLIGSAAHHRTIDMLQMRKRRFDAADAAVEDHRKPRMRALEPIDPLVIERRNLAVFLRRQAVEPSFT